MYRSLSRCVVAIPMTLALLALPALTGCGIGAAPTLDPFQPEVITGSIHGGQQPISGATIQLYQVGITGYGKGAAAVGSSVLSQADGSFSITGKYGCPTSNTLVYITATGGNPGLGTGNNPNIKLMAALGICGNLNLNTFIAINEVTTVAAAEAMSQYFTTTFGAASTDGFGSPNTTQALTGMANAFTTSATLANTTTGNANTSLTTNGAGGTITITPEALKVQTIADVIAACVNSAGGTAGDGTNCGVLFGDSGPTGVTPTNTLQAAVLLNLNPTSSNANGSANNIAALFGLVMPAAPFTAQASQPVDWTVGILYTATAATMAQPLNLAIDGGGNVWVVNSQSGAGGSLNEISPGGSMLVFNQLNATVGGVAVTGSTLTPRNVAIDLTGNVWVPTSTGAGDVFEYVTASGTVNGLAVGKSPYGVAVDGSNNVWFSSQSSSAVNQYVEFLGGTLSTGQQVNYPIASTANQASYLAFDANGNLWSSNALAATSAVTQLTNASSAACTTFPCAGTLTYNTITGVGTQPFGLAGSATNMWTANSASNNVSSITIGATPTATNYGSATSVNAPRFPAIDGVGNVWVSNRNTGGVSEFSGSGTVLSPVPSGSSTAIGFTHAGIATANGIAIDPTGNVWLANNTTSTGGNSIFEIVGAAAPAITPIAQALKTNSYGVKPKAWFDRSACRHAGLSSRRPVVTPACRHAGLSEQSDALTVRMCVTFLHFLNAQGVVRANAASNFLSPAKPISLLSGFLQG